MDESFVPNIIQGIGVAIGIAALLKALFKYSKPRIIGKNKEDDEVIGTGELFLYIFFSLFIVVYSLLLPRVFDMMIESLSWGYPVAHTDTITNTPVDPPAHDSGDNTFDTGIVKWILIFGVGGAVSILAVLYATSTAKKMSSEKKKQQALYNHVQKRVEGLNERISSLSAQYAQACVDPEVVLYKPLLIGNSDLSNEFVNALMSARNTVNDRTNLISSLIPSSVGNEEDEYINQAESKVELAEDLWRKLNIKAEEIGTPILDPNTLRRAERLWKMATNESATQSERDSALDKLESIIKQCRSKLSFMDRQNKKLCDVMSNYIVQSKKKGIIAPPSTLQIRATSRLALETA